MMTHLIRQLALFFHHASFLHAFTESHNNVLFSPWSEKTLIATLYYQGKQVNKRYHKMW